MTLGDLGRALVGVAAVLGMLGAALLVAARIGLGRLPGDLSFGGSGVQVYIPLATCVLLSLIATILLNLLIRR